MEGAYREFEVDPGAITAASGFQRDRKTLSAPESSFRCVELAIRNNSSQDITVTFPSGSQTVPSNTTDIINRGQTFMDDYRLSVAADTADGEVLIVERCRSWNGWSYEAQEG